MVAKKKCTVRDGNPIDAVLNAWQIPDINATRKTKENKNSIFTGNRQQ